MQSELQVFAFIGDYHAYKCLTNFDFLDLARELRQVFVIDVALSVNQASRALDIPEVPPDCFNCLGVERLRRIFVQIEP